MVKVLRGLGGGGGSLSWQDGYEKGTRKNAQVKHI